MEINLYMVPADSGARTHERHQRDINCRRKHLHLFINVFYYLLFTIYHLLFIIIFTLSDLEVCFMSIVAGHVLDGSYSNSFSENI